MQYDIIRLTKIAVYYKKGECMINRDRYLEELVDRKNNGLIKIITGIRRCGKSYLMNRLFCDYLIKNNVKQKNIIKFAFDFDEDIDKLDKYYPDEETKFFEKNKNSYKVNSKKFRAYIEELTNDKENYYLLLDEIQLLDNFVGTLNGFLRHENLDVYVTGSNSKMLSSDIITEFRGRGDQIKIFPLSFKEYFDYAGISFNEAYKEYSVFGGMPLVLSYQKNEQKINYLKGLFDEIYLKDLYERNNIINKESFEMLINILASSIGSYTNSSKLENSFKSELKITYEHNTINKHIEYMKDSFLINESNRYDIKGRRYLKSIYKYYFTDLGLRNARLNFRQQEPTHIMENIIYNELVSRGYGVDIGVVDTFEKNINGNSIKKQLEVDFIVNSGYDQVYIQSVYEISNNNKMLQEINSLKKINNSFRKIIIVNGDIIPWKTEDGIDVIGLKDFLLNNAKIF